MTRPWMGVTPPPHGQGYYRGEFDLPEFFAPKLPSAANGFDFKFDDSLTFTPETDFINKEIRRVMDALHAGLDKATTALVIEHLRGKGYTITEPKEEQA